MRNEESRSVNVVEARQNQDGVSLARARSERRSRWGERDLYCQLERENNREERE